jgi:hypothetical protein
MLGGQKQALLVKSQAKGGALSNFVVFLPHQKKGFTCQKS